MVRAAAVVVALAVLVVGPASEAQQTDNATVDAKLSEIGDATIIVDTEKLVAEAQRELSDITKDVDARRRADEFKIIRLLRLRLNKRSLELRALLESFRQYKLSLTSQLQQKQNSIQTSVSNRLQVDLTSAEHDRLQQEIDGDKAYLEELKKRFSESTDEVGKRDLARDVSRGELEIRAKEAQLSLLEQRKVELSRVSTATQKEADDLNSTVQKIEPILSRAQSTLRNLDETLVEIDEQSNSLLQTDILNMNYTDRSTYIFAILVGAVIIGFFSIAFRSDRVREAIFTGESGIQFVTLFSLVIAIILFGVLKILEGKELAALLGGLSGYILGRGSRSQGDRPATQNNAARPSRGSRSQRDPPPTGNNPAPDLDANPGVT